MGPMSRCESVLGPVKHSRHVFFSQNKGNACQGADANLDFGDTLLSSALLTAAQAADLRNIAG